ncbi:MAG: response regulator transcription factor [Deltaproteobacteria bacterium]|nr:response regulator transcription factor [Deltaproteobacteria bacterium]
MTHILLIEDDKPLRELLVDELAADGHRVESASSGAVGLAAWQRERPALVLLDWMLPGMTGIEVCQKIRASAGPQPIVLMLTARVAEEDAVLGFAAGADDYVRKPFGLLELRARIHALAKLAERRPQPAVAPRRCSANHGSLRLDDAARTVQVDGQVVELTPKEFDLLHYLAAHPGEVFRREALLAAVWGYSHAGYARTVDSHVLRLRRKLTAAGCSEVPIETLHGSGYRWSAQP